VVLPCSRASSISTISFVILKSKRYRTNDREPPRHWFNR
jgi:hypothetical protein